jgi:hypothetical protein
MVRDWGGVDERLLSRRADADPAGIGAQTANEIHRPTARRGDTMGTTTTASFRERQDPSVLEPPASADV